MILSSFFFFKQKTAYEIMPSLVGSEMCIRDRCNHAYPHKSAGLLRATFAKPQRWQGSVHTLSLIHISEPTRLGMISYAVFCLKTKTKKNRAVVTEDANTINNHFTTIQSKST